MKDIVVGLIKGRHELPVSNYIFENEIEDVTNIEKIHETIMDFLDKNINVVIVSGECIAQADYTDIMHYESNENLVVYVTGLTVVTAELIACCLINGIHLDLMHYDRATDSYYKQVIY